MRYQLLVPLMLFGPAIMAPAQVSIGIRLPGLSIGINQPSYPELLPVPDSPVYYAPGAAGNYFFFDGLYWVYQGNEWYSSMWFNGPWGTIGPDEVPYFILRVPVGYYRQPPAYFSAWDRDAPPRWGEHWGRGWEQRRSGWDRWDRHALTQRAPLPTYQRQYSGDRYPGAGQQVALHNRNYNYQPQDVLVRKRYQQESARTAPRLNPGPGPAYQPQAGNVARPDNSGPPAARQPQAEPPRQQGHQVQRGPSSPGKVRQPQGRGAAREGDHGQGGD